MKKILTSGLISLLACTNIPYHKVNLDGSLYEKVYQYVEPLSKSQLNIGIGDNNFYVINALSNNLIMTLGSGGYACTFIDVGANGLNKESDIVQIMSMRLDSRIDMGYINKNHLESLTIKCSIFTGKPKEIYESLMLKAFEYIKSQDLKEENNQN